MDKSADLGDIYNSLTNSVSGVVANSYGAVKDMFHNYEDSAKTKVGNYLLDKLDTPYGQKVLNRYLTRPSNSTNVIKLLSRPHVQKGLSMFVNNPKNKSIISKGFSEYLNNPANMSNMTNIYLNKLKQPKNFMSLAGKVGRGAYNWASDNKLLMGGISLALAYLLFNKKNRPAINNTYGLNRYKVY